MSSEPLERDWPLERDGGFAGGALVGGLGGARSRPCNPVGYAGGALAGGLGGRPEPPM